MLEAPMCQAEIREAEVTWADSSGLSWSSCRCCQVGAWWLQRLGKKRGFCNKQLEGEGGGGVCGSGIWDSRCKAVEAIFGTRDEAIFCLGSSAEPT